MMFKISRLGDEATPGGSGKTASFSRRPRQGRQRHSPRQQCLLEAALIALCFFLYAGQPAPDVNESHYLTKAKHFWDSSYCPGDLFLSSSFSHWLFYISFGWLTKFMSLSAFAWTGRFLTWLLMALAWQKLSHAIVPLKFMSVLSALFFLLLNDRFHLAGEWVVGGFEAKGIAYSCVLLALSFVVRGAWKYVWPLLGFASAFHVLVGGWSVLACLLASFVVQFRRGSNESRTFDFWKSRAKQWWAPLLVGGLISLPGVIPPLLSDWNASGIDRQLAAEVYVSHRIAHHLDFAAFPTWHVARFVVLIVFWWLLYGWLKSRLKVNPLVFHRKLEPLQDFAAGALVISFFGLLLSGLADDGSAFATGMLKFYWFRLADFALPLSISMACCFVIAFWLELENDIFRRMASVVFTVCIFLAASLMFIERHQIAIPNADVRSLPQYPDDEKRFRESWENWKKVCRWIRDNTPAGAVFITPYQQQTFKWYAARTEVVSWKDVPQNAVAMLQWQERLNRIQEPQQFLELQLLSFSDQRLRELAQEFSANYLVVPQAVYELACTDPSGRPKFDVVYPESPSASTWVVLELREQ